MRRGLSLAMVTKGSGEEAESGVLHKEKLKEINEYWNAESKKQKGGIYTQEGRKTNGRRCST